MQTYGKEIVALLVPFLTWVLNVGIKAKVKLIWTSPHSFTHLIQGIGGEPGQPARSGTLHVASMVIVNAGRDTATNVEVVFNHKPPFLNLWPVRPAQEHVGADGRFTLTFTSFAPKEELRLEMIAVDSQVPGVLLVRSDQHVANRLDMRYVRRLPNWQNRLIVFLLFAGLGTVVYWGIALTQILVLKTPI
ncbi:hypothetical protein ACSFA8_19150 [Variovorax sp. RT4R15]|uniref:hypothetical protein n=1 Tax=Variovorax sp. RT4R15 TaxID=3443737 RepID=UPI003F47CD8C